MTTQGQQVMSGVPWRINYLNDLPVPQAFEAPLREGLLFRGIASLGGQKLCRIRLGSF